MIYYHHFLTDCSGYAARGRNNDFPELQCCPNCRARNRMLRHGFYERNAIDAEATYRISICRLLCPAYHKSVSILPTFLLPYFQHTWRTILNMLLAWWISCLCVCSRQLRRFYEKRGWKKQNEIALFFRSEGVEAIFPEKKAEKAICLFQMIQAMEEATFVRRWWHHRINSFMAAVNYRGARVAPTF
ncbi:hypothetical protein IDH44_07180 [Paenibacillus sp. IB182496]|uniref:Uncharacterized protein n=1 Tax=Paenibacillus sabuli TaxID=2772509 RepID=A0A927GRS1_9BACL|nr:hypothetical protein [Paenibacillus sabuli]MBD2844967.1 hypothetical protein [Paenibacillus sabuli]